MMADCEPGVSVYLDLDSFYGEFEYGLHDTVEYKLKESVSNWIHRYMEVSVDKAVLRSVQSLFWQIIETSIQYYHLIGCDFHSHVSYCWLICSSFEAISYH